MKRDQNESNAESGAGFFNPQSEISNPQSTAPQSDAPTPVRLLFDIAVAVCSIKAGIMLAFAYVLPPMSFLQEIVFDRFLLTALLFPAIYFRVYRPMMNDRRQLADDIVHLEKDEIELREAEARFRNIVACSADAIIVTDADGIVAYVNPAAASDFNRKAEAFVGSNFGLPIVSGETTEIDIVRGAGITGIGEMRVVESSWLNRPAKLIMIRDITEMREYQRELEKSAHHDALTRLPNRALLLDRLQQAVIAHDRSGHYGALLFLDLDNFKPLNDTHGHDAGDMLLIEVARRITGSIRKVDTKARLGGDEFVVMLDGLHADKTEAISYTHAVAGKILAALNEPYLLRSLKPGDDDCVIEHHCSASIGLVLFDRGATPEEILKRADQAMYQAKKAGRNRVCFLDQGEE